MSKNACCGAISSMCQGAIDQQLGVMANESNRQATSPPPRSAHFSPHSSLGEQQLQSLDNAKSAFEITSVSDAPPDGEEEQVQVRDTEDAKGNTEDPDKRDKSGYQPNSETHESSHQEQLGEPSTSQLASSSTSDLLEGGSRQTNASVANGPSQMGQSRFRRVNHYVRGRWTVRDTLEPEERPESENKMATLPLVALRNNSDLSLVSTSAASRKTIPDTDVQSRSVGEAGYLADISSTTSRDPSSITDRSSTTVESHTISRNTSFSSLSVHTAERTTEEDQRERLEEVEPEYPLMVTQRAQTTDIATQCSLIEQPPPHHCSCSICTQRFVCLCLFVRPYLVLKGNCRQMYMRNYTRMW